LDVKQIEKHQEQNDDSNDAYSLYVYAIRSPVTRDVYLRRLRIFFNHIHILSMDEPMDVRCNIFAQKASSNSRWAFSKILEFLQFQKERVENQEISPATLRNFVKAIKLFCEMAEIEISWKKITRGLPRTKRYADDRAPTLEEIQKIVEYPDRRIKAIVYTMASSGIRLGAWEYLRWGHIQPVRENEKIVAAKIIVYPGDTEEYITFMTSEAYFELEKWMKFRKEAGEEINEKSWVMRWKWDNKKGHARGLVTAPKKLETIGIKRLINDALWSQGIRKKSQLNKNRYEFQVDHGFRKWFKTRCELAGIKSINIELLIGHSIGISDSYYRITENELLKDYLRATKFLTIAKNNSEVFEEELDKLREKNENNEYIIKSKLQEKDDALVMLSDQVMKLMEEVKQLKMIKSSTSNG
jgi:integrase